MLIKQDPDTGDWLPDFTEVLAVSGYMSYGTFWKTGGRKARPDTLGMILRSYAEYAALVDPGCTVNYKDRFPETIATRWLRVHEALEVDAEYQEYRKRQQAGKRLV